MRDRHSEPKQKSPEPRPSQPPVSGGEQRREDRSRRADVGAAPGQDEDVEVDDDRDTEDEPAGRNQMPRVEPPRQQDRRVQTTRRGQSTANTKQRGNHKKS